MKFCGISSGSSRFAKVLIFEFQVFKGLNSIHFNDLEKKNPVIIQGQCS